MDDQRTDREGSADLANRRRDVEKYKGIAKTLRAGGWFGIIGALSVLSMASSENRQNYVFGAALLFIAGYMHYRGFVATRAIRKEESELRKDFPTT